MTLNANEHDVTHNEIVELSDEELQVISGGPQEQNIPPR